MPMHYTFPAKTGQKFKIPQITVKYGKIPYKKLSNFYQNFSLDTYYKAVNQIYRTKSYFTVHHAQNRVISMALITQDIITRSHGSTSTQKKSKKHYLGYFIDIQDSFLSKASNTLKTSWVVKTGMRTAEQSWGWTPRCAVQDSFVNCEAQSTKHKAQSITNH